MALALLGVIFVPVTTAADDSTDKVTIELVGDTTLGISEKRMYKLVISGGPANNTSNGTYSWTGVIGGELASLAKMSSSSGGPSTNGTFFINVTAPSSAGEFTITFTGKSSNGTVNQTVTKKINFEAIYPIAFKVTIKNAGNVTVNNVPVSIYLNDDPENKELIYSTTVNVSALGQAIIWYNWTSFDLSHGEHQILFQMDPNSTFVSFADGSSEYTSTIYFKVSGYGDINAYLWAFVVILAVLAYLIYRRPMPRRKKGKKK